jgi:hypothetical protein
MQKTAVWTTIFDGRNVDRDRDWIAIGDDPVDQCREELAVIVDHHLTAAEASH